MTSKKPGHSTTCDRASAGLESRESALYHGHGAWAAHLYDPQPRHKATAEHVPTCQGVPVLGEISREAWEAVMGAAFVLLPLMLAAWGWSM